MKEIKNIIYATIHPIKAAETKARQIAVSIEHSSPPLGSTIEEFPELSLKDAAELLYPKTERGAVPLSAWSLEDQERMKRGELPKGAPEHPNV